MLDADTLLFRYLDARAIVHDGPAQITASKLKERICLELAGYAVRVHSMEFTGQVKDDDRKKRMDSCVFSFRLRSGKIHFEKLSQVVGQFGTLIFEDSTLAKDTKLDLTIIHTSSVIPSEQIMKVSNSVSAKLFKDSRVQIQDVFRVQV